MNFDALESAFVRACAAGAAEALAAPTADPPSAPLAMADRRTARQLLLQALLSDALLAVCVTRTPTRPSPASTEPDSVMPAVAQAFAAAVGEHHRIPPPPLGSVALVSAATLSYQQLVRDMVDEHSASRAESLALWRFLNDRWGASPMPHRFMRLLHAYRELFAHIIHDDLPPAPVQPNAWNAEVVDELVQQFFSVARRCRYSWMIFRPAASTASADVERLSHLWREACVRSGIRPGVTEWPQEATRLALGRLLYRVACWVTEGDSRAADGASSQRSGPRQRCPWWLPFVPPAAIAQQVYLALIDEETRQVCEMAMLLREFGPPASDAPAAADADASAVDDPSAYVARKMRHAARTLEGTSISHRSAVAPADVHEGSEAMETASNATVASDTPADSELSAALPTLAEAGADAVAAHVQLRFANGTCHLQGDGITPIRLHLD
eukprot:ctg_1404.g421